MKERIKKLRKALSMSQTKFAQVIGVSSPYVSMLENGKYKLSLDKLVLLSDTYKVNLNWMISGTGPMFQEESAHYNNVPARENKKKDLPGASLTPEEVNALRDQVRELKKKVAVIREDNTHLRHESEEANRELRTAMKKIIQLQEVLLEK